MLDGRSAPLVSELIEANLPLRPIYLSGWDSEISSAYRYWQ